MAGNTDYFPKKDLELSTWCKSYRQLLPQYATQLGLTPEEINEQQQWCDEIVQKIREADDAKSLAKAATAAKDKTRNQNIAKLRNSIRRIKIAAGYSSPVGTQLNIIGGKKYSVTESDFSPTFKLKVMGNHVRLDYKKRGISGIEVFREIPGHEKWRSIGSDNHSPFIDSQPEKIPGVPELRRYKIIALINDNRFGQFSNEQEVAVKFSL
jgi:hypothetical protein